MSDYKKLDTKELANYRRTLLSNATGEILELGIGIGTNLAYYPRTIHQITGVDQKIKPLQKERPETEHYYVDYKKLPFEDNQFDTVVVTFFFSQIVDLSPILSEIKRILKSRGRLILMDYGRSMNTKESILQDLANPLYEIFLGKVIIRDYFEILQQEKFFFANPVRKKLMIPPKSLFGTIYMGVAVNVK